MAYGNVNVPGKITAADVGASPVGHTHTAADVGARPATWTPTAADVGAAPANHTHTPASIGAAAATHTHTAAQVGARPSTWTPTAADVGAVPTTRKVNNKALSADISLTAADVGAVPTTRTVNSKALSANITLSAADVGAAASSHTHSYAGSASAGGAATSALACTGNAATATKLATARTIRTNLASTTAVSFDGSANITPGVTGILPVANGGTGKSTAPVAQWTKLGSRTITKFYVDGTKTAETIVADHFVDVSAYDLVVQTFKGSITISTKVSALNVYSGTDGYAGFLIAYAFNVPAGTYQVNAVVCPPGKHDGIAGLYPEACQINLGGITAIRVQGSTEQAKLTGSIVQTVYGIKFS